MLSHFSLFTGIGGIDLASEWAGFQTIGQCEYADYPTKVLEKHWPDVPRWKDVRDVTRYSIRQRGIDPDGITLLSGGFPCQPHSLAGKRKASADERDLWGEFARVICETHPRWVLGENVFGLLSSEDGRFFGRVLRDLAEMGYRVGWACYGAVDVGANHQRDRTFIVGYSERSGLQWQQRRRANSQLTNGCENAIIDANRIGRLRRTVSPLPEEHGSNNSGVCENVAHTDSQRGCLRDGERQDAEDAGQSSGCAWLGNWLIEPDVGRVAHGVPARVDRLKCLGNAVVPQQVYPILKAIAEIEQQSEF